MTLHLERPGMRAGGVGELTFVVVVELFFSGWGCGREKGRNCLQMGR